MTDVYRTQVMKVAEVLPGDKVALTAQQLLDMGGPAPYGSNIQVDRITELPGGKRVLIFDGYSSGSSAYRFILHRDEEVLVRRLEDSQDLPEEWGEPPEVLTIPVTQVRAGDRIRRTKRIRVQELGKAVSSAIPVPETMEVISVNLLAEERQVRINGRNFRLEHYSIEDEVTIEREAIRCRVSPTMLEPPRGLYGKYNVSKADGSPRDPNARYFVLRYDKDDAHGEACRAALATYAKHIKSTLPELAADLEKILKEY